MANFNRYFSAVLLAVIAANTVSCGGTGTSADTTASGDTEPVVTEDPHIVKDDLPARDFGGETFTFLVRDNEKTEFVADEQTGEVVNDAVYARNQRLSERFNLTFEYVVQPGNWASKDPYIATVTSAVMAGDDAYDVITGQSNITAPLAVQGLYWDLADDTNIDLSKPYWKKGYLDNAMINGHLYSLMGDYGKTTLTNTNCMFFNMQLFDDYQVEYPYQAVRDGTWTIDKFISTAKVFSKDLNGDSTMDPHDLYGLICETNGYNPFQYSTGCSLTKLEKDGTRVVDFPTEKDVEVYDKLFDFFTSTHFRNTSTMPADYTVTMAFMAGTTAFYAGKLSAVESLREMVSDFGTRSITKHRKITSAPSCAP